MDLFEEREKMGGLHGYLRLLIDRELAKANEDESHPFRPAIEALRRGANTKATRLFETALKNVTANDPPSLIELAKLAHLLLKQIPHLKEHLEKDKDEQILRLLNNRASLEDYANWIGVEEDAKKHRASRRGSEEGAKRKAENFPQK